MALTVRGQPAKEKQRAFRRWQGRERQRLKEQYRLNKQNFERLQMQLNQPKTGLRS